jgi:lipopolysaccharide/colanic/teichoic acid biosynthesis glycosyltransferase
VRRHVLDEAVFRSVVVRHRKRAERASQPLAIVVITSEEGPATESASTWDRITAALAAETRDTDLLGWIQRGSVLGVILPAIPAPDETPFLTLEPALVARLSQEVSGRYSLRLHTLAGTASSAEPAGLSHDGFFFTPRPRRRRARMFDAAKRALDIAGSLVLLAVLAPLLLLIAVSIKATSRGPALFRQVRVGQMMKPFTFLKFRTMAANANQASHQAFVTEFIQGRGPARQSEKPALFKMVNDPRVTRVGRVLRRTSLDELPQLWNVLRGDMSLVGPRPPIPYEVDRYQPWHRRRVLEAKPGVTGLWQVAGRSRTTFDEMVRLDLRYARTRSLWTDIKILLATPAAVIAGKGAC